MWYWDGSVGEAYEAEGVVRRRHALAVTCREGSYGELPELQAEFPAQVRGHAMIALATATWGRYSSIGGVTGKTWSIGWRGWPET